MDIDSDLDWLIVYHFHELINNNKDQIIVPVFLGWEKIQSYDKIYEYIFPTISYN